MKFVQTVVKNWNEMAEYVFCIVQLFQND